MRRVTTSKTISYCRMSYRVFCVARRSTVNRRAFAPPAATTSGRRNSGSCSILLQRCLAGRVESVMMDDRMDHGGSGQAGAHDYLVEGIVERSAGFVATLLEENETKRGNQLRRQRVASRSNAA